MTPELSLDFTNPLNFKISHYGLLNFELLLIRTYPLILTVKNTKKTKISLIFFLNNKKTIESWNFIPKLGVSNV